MLFRKCMGWVLWIWWNGTAWICRRVSSLGRSCFCKDRRQKRKATWFLWAATVAWTLGFDTVYAMSDRDDDQKLGVNSSALFFGDYAPEAVGLFFAITVGFLTRLGFVMQLHWGFWMALGVATIGWIWHYMRLRQPEIPKPVYGEIFRQNVWIGFVVLAGMIGGLVK